MPAGSLFSRLVARVDGLFGQEDIVLRLAVGALEPGFVADESTWRGWRIRREGAHVTIRRTYPWWERLFRGSEVNPHGGPLRFLRAMIYGRYAFEYRLEAELDGALLRGRIMVGDLHRAMMVAFFWMVGVVFPALALLVVAQGTVTELEAAWPDPEALLWAMLRALGALLVMGAVAAVFLGMVVGMVGLMRSHGEPNRAALLAFLGQIGERVRAP